MKYAIVLIISTVFLLGKEPPGSSLSAADEISGEYIGKLMDPSLASAIDDHKITITKIDDNTVKIAPSITTSSATFEATVTKVNGAIHIKSSSDILANNGMYAPTVNRFSYIYHLGGNDDRNVQLFTGRKEH